MQILRQIPYMCLAAALVAAVFGCSSGTQDEVQVAAVVDPANTQLASTGQVPSPAEPAGEQPYLTAEHRGLEPATVLDHVRQLSAVRRLGYAEQFDAGSALLQQGRCTGAAVAYEAAAGQADTDKQRALAYLLAAQAAALAPSENERISKAEANRRAGELANRAQRFAPDMPEIAGYRYCFWKAAGDELEADAAYALVSRRDLKVDGEAVLDPATATVIVVGVVAGVLTIWAHKEGLLSREQAAGLIISAIGLLLRAPQVQRIGGV